MRIIYAQNIRWQDIERMKKRFESLGYENVEIADSSDGYVLLADEKKERNDGVGVL